MNRFRVILVSSTILLIAAGNADAQTISAVVNRSSGQAVYTRQVEPIYAETIVAGQPYSGVQISETVQTLADGTHITQTRMKRRIYRDSQGRTRSETTLIPTLNSENGSQVSLIEIRDPVEGLGYVLDEQNHVAYRYLWAPRPAANVSVKAEVGSRVTVSTGDPAESHTVAEVHIDSMSPIARASGAPVTEQLGMQNIFGVMASGTRTTQTTEVGAIGNDRPISRVCESWTSPELKMMLLSKCSDPRFGDTSTRIEDLDLAEPDAALFHPPADYAVVDETGPVTFKVTRTASPQP